MEAVISFMFCDQACAGVEMRVLEHSPSVPGVQINHLFIYLCIYFLIKAFLQEITIWIEIKLATISHCHWESSVIRPAKEQL